MASSKETKQYNRFKIILRIVSALVGIGFLIILLVSGASVAVEETVNRWTRTPLIAFMLYVLVLGAAGTVIELPLSYTSGFLLEHRFGLSQQTFGRWCWEEVKGIIVGMVIGLPLVLVFYLLLRRYPVFWWIPVGAIYFLFSVLLARLAPVLLFPLFYRFTPVEDEELTSRLKRMSEREGLIIHGVFQFDLSRNTKKANAAFTGLGKSRRILLADNLLDGFPADEVESVLAHELGHYRFGHLWKGLLVGLVLSLCGLYAANLGYRSTMGAFGGIRGDELAVLPLLALFLMAFGLLTAPVQNGLSRRFERQADAYVLDRIDHPESFISALKRLGRLNKVDETPHPFVEFYFYSHPSLSRRIQAIRELTGAKA
jgi:STE24 endopeptidase